MIGLSLNDQAMEMAKELATSNLSWSGIRIFEHIRNVLIPGGPPAVKFPTCDTVRVQRIFHLLI